MPDTMRARYAGLWDVDGVIIDSAEQHRAAWEALAEGDQERVIDVLRSAVS